MVCCNYSPDLWGYINELSAQSGSIIRAYGSVYEQESRTRLGKALVYIAACSMENRRSATEVIGNTSNVVLRTGWARFTKAAVRDPKDSSIVGQ